MSKATGGAATSAFGEWGSDAGLPVFHERLHPDDAACWWDPVVAAPTNRHFCAVGNRRFQVVWDSFGGAAIRDTARGMRWLTARSPGTGVTIVHDDDGRTWATDRPRWPSGWSAPSAPVRTWGPTWTTIAGTHDGITVERTVACPEGERPWVLVRVRLSSTGHRRVRFVEEWCLAATGDAHVDEHGVTIDEARGAIRVASGGTDLLVDVSDVVDGHRTVRLERLVDLGVEPHDWWLAIGLPEEDRAPEDAPALWAASLEQLRGRLPSATCDAIPALAREIPWHVALLTGGACEDHVLGGHTLDQGSAYSFDLGFNGAARDPLQHALPLVYCEPDLALSVLRNTCAWAGPDGALPYALDADKRPITEWFTPSDQALWSLWLAVEYAAATDDLEALRAPAPFHPVHQSEPVPLVEHLIGHLRHLVDVVGVGDHGHIRIRNADWNDSALTLAGIDRVLMEEQGESVLNSAMAAWVLPRFAGLLRRLDPERWRSTADEADDLATGWRALVAGEWNGRWFRRAYGPGAVVGDEDLWLEAQPWAILCGAADEHRAGELLGMIDEVLRRDSPLGARLRGPVPIRVPEGRVAGEGSAGGVWPSINMTLAWAASSIDPAYAWDELGRMTLDAHTRAYPAIWEGTISGPDAYNTVESLRPGATWAWPDRGIGMQTFPVNNLHSHAQVVFTYLRLLGVEPMVDGRLAMPTRAVGTFGSRTFRV